ncbi:fucose 4-O-acetylase-like acetyltransferase [Kitasatospora sp. GP30]|nr:fucose 4-O-acetylase-like acetyltransferase [Kitasatospora sp. GP30]
MRTMGRDRYVDFLRAFSICLVVLGHWLITGLVRAPDGTIAAPELLATVPWTQWLTLGFQIMPLFFLAGGHAAAGSWAGRSQPAAGWVRSRALRLLVPTAGYAVLVLLAVGISTALGVDRPTLALVGWALGMQFWFLPLYLLLSAATPLLHAAHRRWGVLVPVALGAASLLLGRTQLSPLNYLLVWGTAYQLGFCWRDGQLTRRRLTAPALLTTGAAAFALLVGFGPYPVSLILVTGEAVSNTNPPSAAMLAWVVAQTGLCLLLAPPVRRLLARDRIWRLVRPMGSASMALYLWHMVPVLVLAAALYLTDLAPEPSYGSGAWWLLRLPWLLLLAALLPLLLAALTPLNRLLARLHTALRPTTPVGPAGLATLTLGLALTTVALTHWAASGFAAGGTFPLGTTLEFACGLACLAPAGWSRGRERSLGGKVCKRAAIPARWADE